MFWRLGFSTISPVEQLLASENFTLEQLLDEADLIQECKQLNKKLVDSLATPDQVRALIDYVVVEPPQDGDDKIKFIYPFKSSEVLASDIHRIYDCIFANEELTDKLFSFLDSDAPLNALLAGYFAKVVSTLLTRRPEETLKVIETKGIIPQLLRHLDTYSILELLLKVIGELEEFVGPGKESDWIHKIDLVGRLIEMFDKDLDNEVHANAAIALVGFITQRQVPHWQCSSLASCQSKFASVLLEGHNVELLIQKTLGGSPSTLQHGLTILVELVRYCGSCRNPSESHVVVQVVLKRLGEFVDILNNPPPMPPITNTTGTLNPPLGTNRLKILQMMQELVRLRLPNVEEKLVELKVMKVCLELLIQFEWHTFLHNLVHSMVEETLQGCGLELKRSLFTDARVLDVIIEAHANNDEFVKQPKCCRKGYMGQLRMISNAIMRQASNETWVHEWTEKPSWTDFVHMCLEPANMLNDKSHHGLRTPKSPDAQDDEELFQSPTSGGGVYDSGFQFRPPYSEDDLFGSGDYDGDTVELGSQDMDIDQHNDANEHGYAMGSGGADAAEDELSESVNAMHVDASPPRDSSPSKDAEKKTEEVPDYNDINFWKPKNDWFSRETDS